MTEGHTLSLKSRFISHGRKGFSLIEVLVGAVILALVMIPAMNVVGGSTKAVVGTKDQNQAIFIAQQLMEKARAWPFDVLELTAPEAAGKPEKTFEKLVADSLSNYTINGVAYIVKNFRITKVAPAAGGKPLLATISFGIIFKGKDGRNHGPLEFNSAIPK